VTIAEAARIGKCSIEEIFAVLRPLGFIMVDTPTPVESTMEVQPTIPERTFHRSLDVRETIAAGYDPFQRIMQEVKSLKASQTLLLINSFEPVPLIRILRQQGFEIEVFQGDTDTFYTYITHISDASKPVQKNITTEDHFQLIADRFHGRFQKIDVRALPMPQPMVAILLALETLPENMALFVEHKKVPLFLLPELHEKQYAVVHQCTDQGVQLIIYKS